MHSPVVRRILLLVCSLFLFYLYALMPSSGGEGAIGTLPAEAQDAGEQAVPDDGQSTSSTSDAAAITGGGDATIEQDTEGGVRVNNLANLEALLNIMANSLEIYGIASTGSFFAGAIIMFIMKKPWFGVVMLILCPVSVTFGLAAPGVINWLVASLRDANMEDQFYLAFIPVLFALLAAVVIGFIPSMIAFKRKHEHRWPIFGATFVSWLVPFGWPALLFWSLWTPKKVDSVQ